MTVVIVWVLLVSGYYGVDGKEFQTKDACREWALARLYAMPKSHWPDGWSCVKAEYQQPADRIEDRERP